jgi:hypothetical protein
VQVYDAAEAVLVDELERHADIRRQPEDDRVDEPMMVRG